VEGHDLRAALGQRNQRALDSVIGADMEPFAFAYLDDIIVIAATEEQHLANLGEVFRGLRRANLWPRD